MTNPEMASGTLTTGIQLSLERQVRVEREWEEGEDNGFTSEPGADWMGSQVPYSLSLLVAGGVNVPVPAVQRAQV